MNTALPITPLSRVVSGESPLKNPLHLGLLFFLWFLPMTLFLLVLSGGFGDHHDWAYRVQFILPWLGTFAVLALVLSAFVGRGASAGWTLTVHVLGIALLYVWEQWPR